MSYHCYLHNWVSVVEMCPICCQSMIQTSSNSDTSPDFFVMTSGQELEKLRAERDTLVISEKNLMQDVAKLMLERDALSVKLSELNTAYEFVKETVEKWVESYDALAADNAALREALEGIGLAFTKDDELEEAVAFGDVKRALATTSPGSKLLAELNALRELESLASILSNIYRNGKTDSEATDRLKAFGITKINESLEAVKKAREVGERSHEKTWACINPTGDGCDGTHKESEVGE